MSTDVTNPFDFSDFGAAPLGASSAAPSSNGFPSHGKNALSHNAFDPFSTGQPAQAEAHKTFPVTPASSELIHVARPPLALFAFALGIAGAGIVLAAVWGQTLVAAASGWLLAGPIAIGALSMYARIDTQRRAEAVYSAPGWTGALYRLIVVVCFAGIALGAWHLAIWAGGQ